jgi:hypothetical protein
VLEPQPEPETAVPKSKVRKKTDTPTLRTSGLAPQARELAPSPRWYPIVMVTVMLLGLAWLLVYYLAGNDANHPLPPWTGLGAWNYLIGLGTMFLGLLMAVRWR